jgi:hypothetical protein
MRVPRIEFGTVPVGPPWWSAIVFMLGMVVAVSGFWRWSDAQTRMERASEQVQAKRDAALPPALLLTVAQSHDDQLAIGKAQTNNVAIAALNLPWHDVLDRLEKSASSDVAILKLDVDGAKREIRISGEARNVTAMLAYVKKLDAPAAFGPGVRLLYHQAAERGDPLGDRFELVMPWRTVQ